MVRLYEFKLHAEDESNLQASNWRTPVATKLACDRFQQPAIPVKNERNKKKKDTAYRAITERDMSVDWNDQKKWN